MQGLALVDRVIETGRVPDPVLRAGIRAVCASRLRRERRRPHDFRDAFVRRLRESPIAEQVDKANEQHYEVPAEFFRLVLGPRLKYCALPLAATASTTLDAGRGGDARADLRARRRRGRDGRCSTSAAAGARCRCGWRSAIRRRRSSRSPTRGRSASSSRRARPRGLTTSRSSPPTSTTLEPDDRFDRVVSVEMFEHMRNCDALFARIARWLKPDGRFFVHVFSHRRLAYPYDGRLDGAPLLHRRARCRRDDLLPRFEQRPRGSRPTGRVSGHALRAHRGGLAGAAGRQPDRRRARRRPPLGRELARLLPRLRRALGIPARDGVAGLALPLREAERDSPAEQLASRDPAAGRERDEDARPLFVLAVGGVVPVLLVGAPFE